VVDMREYGAPSACLSVCCCSYRCLSRVIRLDRQMRELKEEMASLSRQEEEHKKRKTDAVSILFSMSVLKVDTQLYCPSSIIALMRGQKIRI